MGTLSYVSSQGTLQVWSILLTVGQLGNCRRYFIFEFSLFTMNAATLSWIAFSDAWCA